MVKAVSTIIAGDRIFKPGQSVTGLSPVDMAWMEKAGHITKTAERRRNSSAGTTGNTQKEADADELQGSVSG